MFVYLVMLVLISLMFIFQKVTQPEMIKQNTNGNKKITLTALCVFFVLAFVAAFRYRVGTDFHSYFKTETWAGKFVEGDFSDPGFTLFAKIASWLFGGKDGAVTILSAIVTVALFIFTIAKHSESFTMSVFLFVFIGCFTGMFNGVRQYLATGILFAGFHYVVNKKLIKWLIVVLIASTVHITAILMFFVYFICNLKCDWKLILLYFILAVVLLFAYEPLFDLIGNLKQEEIDTSYEYMNSSVNIFRILVQCAPIVLFLFVDRSKLNSDKEARFLFNICLFNGALAIAAMNSPYLARFWIYTSCFQVLMYPKVLNKISGNDKIIFTIIIIACYVVFWAYEIMNSPALSTFRWIFNYL